MTQKVQLFVIRYWLLGKIVPPKNADIEYQKSKDRRQIREVY
jgi:hypothetical protein